MIRNPISGPDWWIRRANRRLAGGLSSFFAGQRTDPTEQASSGSQIRMFKDG